VKVWKVILAALVIFCAGAVTGALLQGLKSLPPASQGKPSQPSWGSRPRGDLADRMQRELDLTAPERAKVEQILRESNDRSKQIWESAREEHRQLKANLRDTLSSEEQKKKFDEMFKPRPPFKPGESRSRDSRKPSERPERRSDSGLDSMPNHPPTAPAR